MAGGAGPAGAFQVGLAGPPRRSLAHEPVALAGPSAAPNRRTRQGPPCALHDHIIPDLQSAEFALCL
jgi:hypothetical protein